MMTLAVLCCASCCGATVTLDDQAFRDVVMRDITITSGEAFRNGRFDGPLTMTATLDGTALEDWDVIQSVRFTADVESDTPWTATATVGDIATIVDYRGDANVKMVAWASWQHYLESQQLVPFSLVIDEPIEAYDFKWTVIERPGVPEPSSAVVLLIGLLACVTRCPLRS